MSEGIFHTAMMIIEKAREQGIELRLIGSNAFRVHCPNFQHLFSTMKRELTDVDLVGLSQQWSRIVKLCESMGFIFDRRHAMHYPDRLLFTVPAHNNLHVDVFLDRLCYCHTIDLRSRLKFDFPTIPLADLLLEKMQIVQINEKDIIDTIVLLREHELGETEDGRIDSKYISELLSRDWGLYYTVTSNLKLVHEFLAKYPALAQEGVGVVRTRIEELLKRIEEKPKSMGWKLRARVGPSRKWYRDVDESPS